MKKLTKKEKLLKLIMDVLVAECYENIFYDRDRYWVRTIYKYDNKTEFDIKLTINDEYYVGVYLSFDYNKSGDLSIYKCVNQFNSKHIFTAIFCEDHGVLLKRTCYTPQKKKSDIFDLLFDIEKCIQEAKELYDTLEIACDEDKE